jgi:hypothetical protein
MSDIFRVVSITEYRPTMPSKEESGEMPLSLCGHFPADLNNFSTAMRRDANLSPSNDFRAFAPSTYVTAGGVEKCEQNQKFGWSRRGQNPDLSRKPHQGLVMPVVTEGTEHRVDIKI